MQVDVPYGSGWWPLELAGVEVRPLAPTAPMVRTAVADLVARAVDAPLSGPSLETLATSAESAAVVVPDATRPVSLPEVLPVVLERILRGGVAAERVTVLMACGTHPPVTDERARQLVGRLPAGVRLRQHDARDPATMRRAGALADGTPVRLAREVVESELVVTVGCVQHHYFAGFGGGPKMIFPGAAGYDEIQRNHRRVIRLDTTPAERDDRCAPGVLRGNPIAEEIWSVVERIPPTMELCLVSGEGGLAWAGAGPFGEPFRAAVERVRGWFEVEPLRVRRMVASSGGAPVDQTLIQAHKAFDAASRFVVDGGELLLFAHMELGGGSPAVEPFLDDPDPQRILDLLSRRYVQYGHTTLRILEKTRRFRVLLVSQLDPALARRLGFEPVADPNRVLARWRQQPEDGPVGLMISRPVYPRSSQLGRGPQPK